MKTITMLLTIFLSIFVAVPSVVFATDYSVSIDDVIVAENSGTTQFTVSVIPAIQDGDEVTLNYGTSNGTADASDYTQISGSLAFDTDGDTDKTITVDISDDGIVEADKNFFVDLSGEIFTEGTGGSGSVIISDNQGEGVITDDDIALASIAATDAAAAEPGDDGQFTVSISNQSDTATVISYTVDGDATAGSDYTALSGNVTIPSNTSSTTIAVSVIDDGLVEDDETVTVTLTAITGGDPQITIGAPNSDTVTITDDDSAAVSIAATDAAAAEPGDDGQFTVSISNQSDTATVISYTFGGDATAASDYTALSGSVTIPANTSSATIDVSVIDDSLVEDDETVTVTLTGITSGDPQITIGAANSDTVTLTDDDSAAVSVAATDANAAEPGNDGQFTVTMTKISDTATVISYTFGGDATAGSDYTALSGSVTIPANTSSATIDVSVMNDSLVEDDETVTVTLTAITGGDPQITIGAANSDVVTISDNDTATFTINDQTVSEAVGTMTLTVSLDNPLDIAVDVDVTYADVTATGGNTDYDSAADQVTFAAGDTTDKTVTVAITNDNLLEATETFTAGLGTGTGLGTRSADFSDTGTGTITDNDTALVSIAANDASAAEPADDGQFTVTMTNQSDTDTVISYNITGNATPGSDYIALSGSVTISANATTATIDVDVSDDNLVEGNETVTVTLTGIMSGHADISIDGANNSDTVTIADDGDTYDVAITSVSPNNVPEADTTVTITVELDNVDVNGVVGTVNVNYATNDSGANPATAGSDYTSTSGTLAFTSATGPTLTVDVPIINDDLLESDETFDFTLSAFSGGGSITGTNPETVTINDDTDKCGFLIDGPYTATEGNSITFNVSINQVVPAGQTVTVQYETADDTAVAEGDYGAISLSTLTFIAGEGPGDDQQIIVNTNDDSLYEIQEHFTVDLSNPSANAAIINGQGNGNIDDDGDTYDVSIEAAETVTEGTDATVTFTVTLDQEVPGGTSVSFTLDDVTAVLGSDYSENTPVPTLNFAADETTKDVVVNITNDDLYEVPETFEINITCGDTNSTLSNDKGTCTINDDGVDTYNVSINAESVPDPVLEADTTVIFTVTLDQEVPGGASVDFSLNDVTAALNIDYSENTASPLNFAAGETTKNIVVNILNDLVDEDSETFEVIITSADPDAILVNDTGTCTITDNDYTVTFNIATVGPVGIDGGTVNGVLSLDQVVDHATDCAPVTAAPNAGYRFVEWTGDYSGTVNPLTITNVTSDMTITANFIAIYTITATAGANGTISPSGAVIVDYGTDQTFIFDPNTCYEVDDVVVDGGSIGGEIREYTFTNVTADHTIDVQFYHYDCTITATAEHGGTITPSGAVTIPCGNNQSFTISAGMDNEIAEVLVDGVDLGIGSGITTYTYNWTNVKKDDDDTSPCVHYIVAKFKRPPLSCLDISDTPLNAMSRSAPANIMFVLDDSGSMDWEFMTNEGDGLFGGKCYVFNDPGDNVYSPWYWEGGVLATNRVDYRSQWSGYNRMYYDPNADYSPWPTRTDADPNTPQSHPMHAGNTLNLSDTYFRILSADDHGNDCASATPISCNTQVEGYIQAEGDVDYYRVDPDDDGTLTVYTTGNIDSYGYLYNSACNLITQNDDSGAGNNFSISYAVPADGTYYIRVQRWNNTGKGSYTLHVNFDDDYDSYPDPTLPANVEIKNAHYYVWSATDSKPYLVNIDGGSITYHAVNDPLAHGGNNDSIVDYSELSVTASPPADVVTGRSYTEERLNFANWYSFYRKRELTATAAIANVITNMQGVNIGFRSINGNLNQPVLKIKVGTVDETNTLLTSLYALTLWAQGTPLRTGMQMVGQYFDDDDGGNTGGIGASPYATAANGGECQQSFAIVMTDGYYNGCDPLGVGNEDGDQGVPYADTYGSVSTDCSSNGDPPTLADVAMYYYKSDLSSTLGPEVPINPWDDNQQQHMVTYGVSFGVTGTLNPNDYDSELKEIVAPHDYVVWPDPTSGDHQKIDDLWHASVNGRGFFLSASNPNELVNSLLDIMQNIEEREGSASSVSVNGDELYTKLSGGGDILMFQSSYDTENWTGDVKAYQVCTELTGNCAGKSIGDIIKSPYAWSANEKLGGLNWNTGRKIVTYNGTDAGKPFRWGDLTTDQQTALNNDLTLLDYLRGDNTNEAASGGSFRDRFGKLGDMVHSSPTFENGVLYAGGNDGMLHAFAAADDEPYAGTVGGEELFAYVPNFVFENLSQLAEPTYTHKYFVDLTPTVKAGVDISGVSTTVLVGGLGKGGRGYYALDVTDPTSWTSEGAIDDKVMWEYPKAGVTDDDMGYSFSKPAIIESNDDDVNGGSGWIVIFGNGYNSQNGHAVLYILNPETGALIKKIDTGVDGCNGLSTVVPIDVNYDNKVDYVYAGDLRGNVWKFDLTDTDYTNWEVAFYDGEEKPLFQAQGPGGTTQPITAKPDVMYHPTEHGYMVLFGTGQYLGESDISDTTAQSFYGIWDYGDDEDDVEYLGSFRRGYGQELSNQPNTVSLLAQQVIPSDSPDPNAPDFWTVTLTDGAGNPYDLLLRLTTDHDIVWETESDGNNTPVTDPLDDLSGSVDNHAGWYFDLPLSGERGNVDMMIRGGVIIAISFIPEDTPCGYGGSSVIHEMNAASGARLTRPQFDVNGDGVIDDNDMINIGTDEDPIWVVPSGMKKAGQLQPPAILIDPDGDVEIKYFSSSSGNIEMVYEKPPLLGISHWREFE